MIYAMMSVDGKVATFLRSFSSKNGMSAAFKTAKEIRDEIAKLSRAEVAKRIAKILNEPERPEIHYTSRGAGYVRPFDILASKSGQATLKRYAASSEKAKQKLEAA